MARGFVRLTRPAIRRLSPGEAITENGITAQRTKDGDVHYSVNVMVDGRRIHRVIGRESDGVTRTQAEEFICKARTEAREGRLQLPKGRKTRLSFSSACVGYLVRMEETDGKNLKAKRRHLDKRLGPYFGNLRLVDITTPAVERYARNRQREGASNATINRELATLSHLLRKAQELGWIESQLCRIFRLKESEGRIIALTDDQCRALMQAAIVDAEPDCWLFVAFGLNTAMRHSEILRARFEDADLENLRLHIPRAKSGAREQPITVELADILRNEMIMRDTSCGWIFPSPRPSTSASGHRDRMSKPFRRAVVAANLDPETVTPHVMRHTAITRLVKAGIDLPTIQRISGHKTLKMVQRYTHIHGDHIDRAISVIGISALEPLKNDSTARLHRNYT